MADGEVLVTFATIQAAAQQTASTNQTIQRLLQDLYQQLQPIYASWSGAASEGFQYQHQRWVAAADDLNTVLQHISSVLLDSHDGYTSAESAAQQLWST
jgi:early secretory antigenic target protein ESAT-6